MKTTKHYMGTTDVLHRDVPIIEWSQASELDTPYIAVNPFDAWLFMGESDSSKAIRVDLSQHGSPITNHTGKTVDVTVTHQLIGITESREN